MRVTEFLNLCHLLEIGQHLQAIRKYLQAIRKYCVLEIGYPFMERLLSLLRILLSLA